MTIFRSMAHSLATIALERKELKVILTYDEQLSSICAGTENPDAYTACDWLVTVLYGLAWDRRKLLRLGKSQLKSSMQEELLPKSPGKQFSQQG